MKNTTCFIVLVFLLTLPACRQRPNTDNSGSRPFGHLHEPILISLPILPGNALSTDTANKAAPLPREVRKEKASGDFYSVVFDWEAQAVFAKTPVTNAPLFGPTFGRYSPLANAYYYYSEATSEILCIHAETGKMDKRIRVHDRPGYIPPFITEQGLLIIQHALMEKEGYRMSIFDTKTDTVTKADIFTPYWCQDLEYAGDRICFITAANQQTNSSDITLFNLTDYSMKKLYTTAPFQFAGDMLAYGSYLLLAVNTGHNTQADGIFLNKPEVIFLDRKTGEFVKKIAFPVTKTYYVVWSFFEYKHELYAIYGDSYTPITNEPIVKRWLYKFDKEQDNFVRLESECLFDIYGYMPLFIRNNKLITIFTDKADFTAGIINLDTLTKEYKQKYHIISDS